MSLPNLPWGYVICAGIAALIAANAVPSKVDTPGYGHSDHVVRIYGISRAIGAVFWFAALMLGIMGISRFAKVTLPPWVWLTCTAIAALLAFVTSSSLTIMGMTGGMLAKGCPRAWAWLVSACIAALIALFTTPTKLSHGQPLSVLAFVLSAVSSAVFWLAAWITGIIGIVRLVKRILSS